MNNHGQHDTGCKKRAAKLIPAPLLLLDCCMGNVYVSFLVRVPTGSPMEQIEQWSKVIEAAASGSREWPEKLIRIQFYDDIRGKNTVIATYDDHGFVDERNWDKQIPPSKSPPYIE